MKVTPAATKYKHTYYANLDKWKYSSKYCFMRALKINFFFVQIKTNPVRLQFHQISSES